MCEDGIKIPECCFCHKPLTTLYEQDNNACLCCIAAFVVDAERGEEEGVVY